MATFPTLSSGKIAKYPLTRRVKQRTGLLVSVDGSEQRFAMGSPLAEFELKFSRLSRADKDTVRTFFRSRKGPLDTSWDLTFEDPPGTSVTYHNLQFIPGQAFEATEDGYRKWSFGLKVRQTR